MCFRSFRSIILGLVVLLSLSWQYVQAEEPLTDEVQVVGDEVRFPPLARSFVDRLFDALRSKTGFVPLPLVASQVVDANTSGIWAGTKTEVQAGVSSIELKFKPTAEARLARVAQADRAGVVMLADEFLFSVTAVPRGLQFRFPLATDPYFRNGVTSEVSPYKRAPARTEFLFAARDAGMYIALPAMIRSEADVAWGALVCPRVIERLIGSRGAPVGYQLRRSPYEVSEVKVSWVGGATANIPLGSKRERIRIEHAASADVPKGVDQSDEVVTVSPLVTLDYKPTAPFEFVRFPRDGQFRQGMLFTVLMQNSPGYRRIQRFSQVAYVQRIHEPSPVPVIIKDSVVNRDEGECYVVGAQRSVWSSYDKQEPVS